MFLWPNKQLYFVFNDANMLAEQLGAGCFQTVPVLFRLGCFRHVGLSKHFDVFERGLLADVFGCFSKHRQKAQAGSANRLGNVLFRLCMTGSVRCFIG
jgi:hypothetical protein